MVRFKTIYFKILVLIPLLSATREIKVFSILFCMKMPLQSSILTYVTAKIDLYKVHKAMVESIQSKRNIEIKARIKSPEEFDSKIELCKSLTNTSGEIIKQCDVFFNSSAGRLKLRHLDAPQKSQLIYYERPDVSGPKLSSFDVLETDNPKLLEKILTQSNGVKGYVNKTRLLFLHGQTRIHLDRVENLGTFLEFEVCLRPEQTMAEGEKIAGDLMKVFELEESSLLTSAYLDEIKK